MRKEGPGSKVRRQEPRELDQEHPTAFIWDPSGLLLQSRCFDVSLSKWPGSGTESATSGAVRDCADPRDNIGRWPDALDHPRILRPCYLPKLELEEGIPEEYRTMVIIPTLLTSEKGSGSLLSRWRYSI